MEKKILFLVESFGVNPSANGLCVQNIVEELELQGNFVQILTSYSSKKNAYDKTIEKNVIRVWRDFLSYIVINSENSAIKRLFYYLRRFKMLLFIFFWPLNSPFLIIKYYLMFKRLSKIHQFDVVVGVYLHIEEVLAALLIKKRNPNTECIIYTLDSMGGRVPLEKPNLFRIRKKSILRWEKICLNYTDYFFSMKSHKKYNTFDNHKRIDKVVFMDIPLINLRKQNFPKKTISQNTQKNIFSLIYTGTVTKDTNNPIKFIDLMKELEFIELNFYGKVDNHTLIFIDKLDQNIKNRIRLHGIVTPKEVNFIQSQADCLITFGSENPNMIPCKIFEYIQSGKPIINAYLIDDDPAKPYLEKYQKSFQFNLNEQNFDLRKNLMEFLVKSCDPNFEKDGDIKKIFYDNTALPFVEFIKNRRK